MDNLTMDSIAEQKAGMSYGKWKALHPHTKEVNPEPEVCLEEEEKPKVFCKICGKEIIGHRSKRHCSNECWQEGTRIRQRAYLARKKERMIANGEI